MNRHWLLCTAIACAPAAANDLYIRGSFNGWGMDNMLVPKDKGIYETQIQISPGNHAFKVGYKDWTAEWVINPSANVSVALDTDYKMDTHPGPEDYLFVKKTALFTFRVDVSDPQAPVLRVHRDETAPVAAVDPHIGHPLQASASYGKETVRFSATDTPLRSYAQSTTIQLRDPGPQFVTYAESGALPRVRSGNLAFDALFALAGFELQQDSVKEIRDGNYNGGAAIACDCFETGEKWHYVWTRDLSYAANLGLALLDPQRVRNSLEFKLSTFRSGGRGEQIVQDTGSGGSWPVSTDRVSWAFGAEAALATLAPDERQAFAARAYSALSNTIDSDRLAAFDKASGLYTGEESFLDWREQSYAAWIVGDIASLASSKALSTNVGHYKALTLAAQLAPDAATGKKYAAWASALKKAINDKLWLDDAGMYSSLTAPHFDGAPLHKFDWLGQSLAIITGVADPARAEKILANYPHGPMGAPVIYPQQPGVPVYHNRAIWPFVTAYGLRAAAQSGNVSVADAAYDTLMRASALNLSNMENLEWLSGQPLLLDEKHPSLIGPVINSKRQLWSVGAYLGMVIEQVFGVHVTPDGMNIQPFITAKLRREVFGKSDTIILDGLRVHGKTITVRVHLPPAAPGNGYYPVESSSGTDVIDVKLGALVKGKQGIRHVNADPYSESRAVFAPREPQPGEAAPKGSTIQLYRDGQPVAKLPAHPASGCFSAEAQFTDSGNRSHHSAARCFGAAIEIPVTDARTVSNIAVSDPDPRFDQRRIKDWGKPDDAFAVGGIKVAKTGDYAVQIKYHNGANQINLGISGGVKWLAVRDQAGRIVAQGVVQLPHARIEKAKTPLVYSTPLPAHLKAGSYRLELTDFFNMSYLQSNSSFSAAGGIDGPSNKFDIYGVRILATKQEKR
ncbi:MAG: esterase [Pseudomonadota bacterium]